MAPLLEFNYSGFAQLIGGLGIAAASVIGSIGVIILGLRGVTAVRQTTLATQASTAIAADTNRKINDPGTGQEAVHRLVNSNMTRMFWALGISSATIAGLVLFLLREIGRTAAARKPGLPY